MSYCSEKTMNKYYYFSFGAGENKVKKCGEKRKEVNRCCEWATFLKIIFLDRHHFLKIVKCALFNDIIIQAKTRGNCHFRKEVHIQKFEF